MNDKSNGNEYFTKIPNEWLRYNKNKPTLTNIFGDLSFYLIYRIRSVQIAHRNYSIINYTYLKEWFDYSKSNKYRKLYKILNLLNDKNIISMNKNINISKTCKGNINIDIKNVDSDFFKVYDYEADYILNDYNGKMDNIKLFTLFGCIKSHYNDISGVCYPTIEQISESTTLSKNTILKGIDELVKIGLISYENVGLKLFRTGEVKNGGNVYTMNYEGNQEKLKQHIQKQKDELKKHNIQFYKSKNANDKRSVSMKMNSLQDKFNEGKIDDKTFSIEMQELEKQYYHLQLDTHNTLEKLNIKPFKQ